MFRLSTAATLLKSRKPFVFHLCLLFLYLTVPSWATQQGGAKMITLPAAIHSGRISLESAIAGRNSTRTFSGEPLSLIEVAQLLWAAQGAHGPSRKRTTPSAGALYPLEIYLAAGHVTGLASGIYRYHPTTHSLEQVMQGHMLGELANAALRQSAVKKGAVCLVVGAVFDRTAKKYGPRARRYVHMESGHAAQNIYLQAFSLDLGTVAIGAFEDERVKRVIGMKEDEFPLYIMPVGRLTAGLDD